MKQKLTFYLLLTIFLSACGQSNTKTENQNQGINMAEQTNISGLENTLKRLKKGELENDFFGLTSNGTDCLYFVYENNEYWWEYLEYSGTDCLYFVYENNVFNIEYEVMTASQKQYFQQLKQYCNENSIRVVETTYQNQPQYNNTKYAPVLRLEINASLEQAEKLGRTLMSSIFNNDADTHYDIVPWEEEKNDTLVE